MFRSSSVELHLILYVNTQLGVWRRKPCVCKQMFQNDVGAHLVNKRWKMRLLSSVSYSRTTESSLVLSCFRSSRSWFNWPAAISSWAEAKLGHIWQQMFWFSSWSSLICLLFTNSSLLGWCGHVGHPVEYLWTRTLANLDKDLVRTEIYFEVNDH